MCPSSLKPPELFPLIAATQFSTPLLACHPVRAESSYLSGPLALTFLGGSYFVCLDSVINTLTKATQGRKEGRKAYFGSQLRVQTIMAGKSRPQEPEVTGHIAYAVRKKRGMDVRTQLAFSFLMTLPAFKVGLPHKLIQAGKAPHKCTQRFIS